MTRLEKTIKKDIDQANEQWQLFTRNEKLLVALSGGKDSLALYHLLRQYPLDLFAVHIRLSKTFRIDFIEKNNLQNDIDVVETDIYDEIKASKSKLNTCFLCARERRKRILQFAEKHGINKIVFGHHRNDVVETLLLNLIFSREVSTLLPKQILFRGKFQIIRPFYTLDEKLLISLRKEKQWYVEPDRCAEAQSSKRAYVRKILLELQKDHHGIDIQENIFSALKSVKNSFLPFTPES
jgi:tRNA 2-thiocytidine biosynthesis protein TtcA